MSCNDGCGETPCNDCNSTPCCCFNPCSTQFSTKEGIASELQNLILAMFGEFTKVIVNGRATWTLPCGSSNTGLPCFPRNTNEGFICYIIRILDQIGLFSASVWSGAVGYCKNTMVTDATSLYVAILDVPAGTPLSNTTYWLLLITAPTGPAGPQGAPGTPGGSNTPAYAIQTTAVTIVPANTSDVIFCEPAAPMAVNLSAIASYASGKRFKIWTNGAFTVTVTPNGAQTINGAATYPMTIANQSIEIVANGVTDWRIF